MSTSFAKCRHKRSAETTAHRSNPHRLARFSLAMTMLVATGCSTTKGASSSGTMSLPDLSNGFLAKEAEVVPDSIEMLPPPPADKSTALSLDQEIYRTTRAYRGKPRWDLATKDADLGPAAVDTFSCAVGVQISEATTPELVKLMRRMLADAGRATGPAKDHYKRHRPFLVNGDASCTPQDEERLAKNGSYPSGHTSIGWAWALVLSEIAPDRAGRILRRGIAYGDSRVICGAHWQSDVNAGRIIGAAAVARLHSNDEFRTLVDAARAEVQEARDKKVLPTRDCKLEESTLNTFAPDAPPQK